ncbi:Ankyrin-1 [Exophiala dermatitidis]
MDGVSVASGVAGLLTLALQVSETIVVYVNSVKERSKNIQELHNELLLLGEVLSGLRDFLQSESARKSIFATNSVLHRALQDCRSRIERIGDKLKVSNGGKVSRTLEKLMWPFEQKEVMHMVENLRRYTQTFQFALTIEGCTLLATSSDAATEGLQKMLDESRRIREMSAQIGLSTEEVSKRAAQLEQIIALLPMLAQTAVDVTGIAQTARLAELRDQERRTSDILDWLAPVNSLHKHQELQSRPAKGTGRWFLEHPDFLHWSEDTTAVRDLLCIGGPGAGKSVLCSLIIDHLRAKFKDDEFAVAYYYYDYSEQQSQSPAQFARVLLRQLCSQGNSVHSVVGEFYQRTRNDVKDQTWFHDLLTVLRSVVATYKCCFIVVDALDEADVQTQRTGFFEVIDAVRNLPGGTVKVLATLRPHVPGIEGKFHNSITIDIIADHADLRRFLDEAVKNHPDYEHTIDDDLREQILDTLADNANGLFLLPALQIRTILDQITKADVRRTLRHLSTSLTEAFQSTINRISSLSLTRRDLAFRTLMWLSHAKRPLTVAELQHALALRLEDRDVDRDNFPSLKTLVDCCCGLVEVDRQGSTIRLVHYSLEEYLRGHDHGLFANADLQITRICLKYLTFESLRPLVFKDTTSFTAAVGAFPLLRYAALEWGHHAHELEVEAFQDLIMPLLSNSLCLIMMARVQDSRKANQHWKSRAWAWAYSGGAGISVAASFGLTSLLKLLIERDRQNLRLDIRNPQGNTPLHEAVIRGHEDAAKLLLDHGADVLVTNYRQCTPLFLAVSYGRTSMVELLLRYGRPQLDVNGPKGFTALHKAVEHGNEDVVITLLQNGALVGAHDNHGMTALHHAAFRGNLSIAKHLVLAGAFVHVTDREGLCPLDYAATGGYTELAKYLLENGGSLSNKGRTAWTPLHRAARGGHTETVAFFLDRGADILAVDFKGNIPLHLAVRSGQIATVQRLLEHDPGLKYEQLFARDTKGSTPRVVAFYTAHYDIHKYLRAAEWDALGQAPSVENALTRAIELGDMEAVRSHLDEHADALNMADEDGQPPLHVALQEGRREIVEFLLERGGSIETVGYHGWRPLHICASLGNVELVDLCLAHGANIESRTDTRQTPLHKAASSRSVAVMRRLLEAGADPSATNDRGMTALHVAAHHNDIDIARLLVVEYNADVLARDRQGLTPAMWAERSARLEVLAFLRGAMKRATVLNVTEAGIGKTRNGSISSSLGRRSSHAGSNSGVLELVDALSDVELDDV